MMRNPVFESSMKRRMRSWRSPLLITLYVAFLLVVSGGALVTLQKAEITLGNLRAGLETYIYLSVMQFMLIVLVAPALTVGAISGERERQTLDLLLCTRVGAMRIVLGKLFSSVCFLALLIVSSMPVMAITMFYGGISIGDMLQMQLFLLVCAIGCCAIGIFCSAVFKRTVTATVVAYLAIFAIGVGTLIIPLVFQQDQLSLLQEYSYMVSSGSGGMAVIGGSTATATVGGAVVRTPKLFFINPGIGLLSLLIDQTGLLQRTLGENLGWRGSQLYSIIDMIGSLAWINMAVMFGCSLILTVLSALFVKPGGRKAKKVKPQ